MDKENKIRQFKLEDGSYITLYKAWEKKHEAYCDMCSARAEYSFNLWAKGSRYVNKIKDAKFDNVSVISGKVFFGNLCSKHAGEVLTKLEVPEDEIKDMLPWYSFPSSLKTNIEKQLREMNVDIGSRVVICRYSGKNSAVIVVPRIK